MSWMELSIDTTHEAVDWVSSLLAATDYTGGVSVTPFDAETEASADSSDRSDWAFTIRLYLPDDYTANEAIDKIDSVLLPLHRTGLTTALQVTTVAEKPVASVSPAPVNRIGERFVILAPDEQYQATAHEIPIRLKKTFTFGSGLHPATITTLRLIERHLNPNMQTLDLGSGTGILSVAMAKLGASVLALDNDKLAVQATQDAVYRNGVAHRVTVMEGSLGQGSNLGHWMGLEAIDNTPTIQPTPAFDLIVANILARVHITLAHDFCHALRRTEPHMGLLITAGFTTDYEADVKAAMTEAGFDCVDCERLDEWVSLVHRLNG
jgi:ribosomal protein L11 methyltransferase